jgi:hypothetical protein
MISFESSVYTLLAKAVRAGQQVRIAVHRDTTAGDTLVVHALPRTVGRGWRPIPAPCSSTARSSTPTTGTGSPTATPAP